MFSVCVCVCVCVCMWISCFFLPAMVNKVEYINPGRGQNFPQGSCPLTLPLAPALYFWFCWLPADFWLLTNAVVHHAADNTGALKMRELKKQEWIAVVENAGVENTGAKTYGKPSIQKFLTVEARIRICLIANGRQSPISGKPNRTDCPGSWGRRVGVEHFDVGAHSDSGAQILRVFILMLYSVFFADVCATHITSYHWYHSVTDITDQWSHQNSKPSTLT